MFFLVFAVLSFSLWFSEWVRLNREADPGGRAFWHASLCFFYRFFLCFLSVLFRWFLVLADGRQRLGGGIWYASLRDYWMFFLCSSCVVVPCVFLRIYCLGCVILCGSWMR